MNIDREQLGPFCQAYLDRLRSIEIPFRYSCEATTKDGADVLLVEFPAGENTNGPVFIEVSEGGSSRWTEMSGSEGETELATPGRVTVRMGSTGRHSHYDEMTLEGLRLVCEMEGLEMTDFDETEALINQSLDEALHFLSTGSTESQTINLL